MLLRLFGARIGKGVLISPDVRIMKPWELTVGDGSALGSRVDIYNFCEIQIGQMVLISQDCHICTGTHDHQDPTMPLHFKPIIVESEAWVAAGSFIGPGVHIGQGAVVGARSVVVKDMPAWTICAGNPCRPLKPRVFHPAS